jgi:GTP-binding protein
LKNFNKELMAKPKLIVITKSDSIDETKRAELKKLRFEKKQAMFISAVAGENIPELIAKLWVSVQEMKESAA